MATPPGIALDRHLDLDRRRGALYVRRAALTLLVLLVLASLAGVFGQRTVTDRATGRAGSLTVESPTHVRGGLMFTTRFTIEARRRLAHPTLVLESGWFDGMQVNSIVPQPKGEKSVQGRTVFTFEPLPAGGRQDYFVGFQVDPTTVGRRSQTSRLLDGDRPVATVHRTLTVLP